MNRVRLVGTTLVILCAAGVSAALASQQSASEPPAKRDGAVAAPQTAEHTYQVDAVHSSLVFRIEHMGIAPFYGVFKDISGTYQFDPEHPEQARFEMTVNVDSIDSHNEHRDNDLKSPTFFNVTEFPEMKFKSTSVQVSGKSMKVAGDLTLHGVTKSIDVDMTYMGRQEGRRGVKTGFDISFTIKRSDFGMDAMVGGGLSDEVRIVMGLEGGKR